MGCRQSKDKKDEKAEGEVAEGAAAAEEGQAAGGEKTPRLVVVLGATGKQGGSLLNALKADSSFKVRAITRNPDSDKAKALAEIEGVEVMKADLDDPDSLKAAMEGAYAAFIVTNFAEVQSQEKETQQGKNAVDAAKAAGVQHVVYSGSHSGTELEKPCQAMDSKADVEAYIKEQEVPYTIVRLALYYENILDDNKPVKNDDGTFILDIPMGDDPLHMVSVAGAGECVHQILLQPDEYKGKTVNLASQVLKVDEYAAILTKGLSDRKVEAGTTTTEEMSKKDEPLAAVFASLYEVMKTGKVDYDIELTRKLNPDMPAFESWVDSNKEELEKLLQ